MLRRASDRGGPGVAGNAGKSVLQVRSLTVRFGDLRVVDDLSVPVADGECLAIIGPSGSGKTVLFKALIGALPYTGTVRWAQLLGGLAALLLGTVLIWLVESPAHIGTETVIGVVFSAALAAGAMVTRAGTPTRPARPRTPAWRPLSSLTCRTPEGLRRQPVLPPAAGALAETSARRPRRTSTGIGAPRRTASATLPNMSRSRPVRPCVVMTIMSAPWACAALMMAAAAGPVQTSVTTPSVSGTR
jgi:energy-coupling factor transporter ATP-binding protein EcfA2